MNRERFEQIVEAYGADPRRWPEPERDAARAFAAAHAEAADLLAGAHDIDAALDVVRGEAQGDDLLAARILATAPKAQPPAKLWRPALALAACAAAGVLIGFKAAEFAPPAGAAEAAINAAFGSPLLDGGEG